MMKKLIIKNLKFIILIVILSTVFWISLFSIINAPKDYEKIQIFITADYVNADKLKNDILEVVDVKDVEIYYSNEENTYYQTQLQTSGILSSDILIVNKELVLTEGATTSFIKLNQDTFTNYGIDLSEFEVVTIDGSIYGIIVYDNEKGIDLLSDYITISENNSYCLVLNNVSYHIGSDSIHEDNITYKVYEVIAKILK